MKSQFQLIVIITVGLVTGACEIKEREPKVIPGSPQIDSITTIKNKELVEPSANPNMGVDTSKKSIKSIALGTIQGDSVIIRYYSPGVRNRVIWGGLVLYDEVWVTGAHSATTIEFKSPMIIGGKLFQGGKYALFTIPGEKVWTVIINTHWKQHLTDEYDPKNDVLRLQVTPTQNSHTERLQYFIEDKGNGKGTISIAWEKVKISFDLLTT